MAISFTLRVFYRKLLRGNRRRNTFCILFHVWPGARILANTLPTRPRRLLKFRQPSYNALLLQSGFPSTTSHKFLPHSLWITLITSYCKLVIANLSHIRLRNRFLSSQSFFTVHTFCKWPSFSKNFSPTHIWQWEWTNVEKWYNFTKVFLI